MKTFAKLLNGDKVHNFSSRIGDALSIFERASNDLKRINEDIAQAIDNNEAEVEELNNQKVTLEAENVVFQDQAKSNNARINQITKFLKS